MRSRVSVGRYSGLRPRLAALATALVAAVGAPILVPSGAIGAPSTAIGEARAHALQSALDASLVTRINELRASFGLSQLTFSQGLFGSASLHCEQMVEGGYFGHRGLNGSSLASRLHAFYPGQGRGDYVVGENLLWGEGPMTGTAIVDEWMKSPPHRANLLNPRWRQIAVAALASPAAPGVYSGLPVTVVTADFGVRR